MIEGEHVFNWVTPTLTNIPTTKSTTPLLNLNLTTT